jgi:hypothetical protein
MNHPAPITLADYFAERASPSEPYLGPVSNDLVDGGCERCRTPITTRTAYLARFGTLRCADCIGDDGFATVADLERFGRTGILPCSGCGHLVPPSDEPRDGITYTYRCPACGTTARFTLTVQALAMYGPGITGSRW